MSNYMLGKVKKLRSSISNRLGYRGVKFFCVHGTLNRDAPDGEFGYPAYSSIRGISLFYSILTIGGSKLNFEENVFHKVFS